MAQANNHQFLCENDSNQQVIMSTLKDFGIPMGKVLQMMRAYYSSTDYIKDTQSFLDNYDRFKQLQSAAKSIDIKLIEDLADDKLQELANKLDDSWCWSYLNSTLPSGAATDQCESKDLEQKQHLEAQIEELQKFKKEWQDVFSSKEAMQAKADELLQRGQWMKIIELGLVLKDVCLGINKIVQTNKKLRQHRQELLRINNDYVEAIIKTFNKEGTVDNGKCDTALMQLRYIKAQCQDEQKETAQSMFGHLANAVSMGFQAYASFTNGFALADIATKAVVNQTYLIGAAQGGLAIGSFVLSGVEAYNWVQYKNIIDDVTAIDRKSVV